MDLSSREELSPGRYLGQPLVFGCQVRLQEQHPNQQREARTWSQALITHMFSYMCDTDPMCGAIRTAAVYSFSHRQAAVRAARQSSSEPAVFHQRRHAI